MDALAALYILLLALLSQSRMKANRLERLYTLTSPPALILIYEKLRGRHLGTGTPFTCLTLLSILVSTAPSTMVLEPILDRIIALQSE